MVPRAGRPTEADPEALAASALSLFAEHGFDDVTMEQIAAANGVSRRTLFRYFPTKAHLVWGGTEEALTALRAALDQVPAWMPPLEGIRAAYRSALDFPPAAYRVTRERMLVIKTHPSLLGHASAYFADTKAEIAAFLAARTGRDAFSLPLQVAASVLVEASFTAMLWWAEHDGDHPAAVVDAALARVSPELLAD